MDWPGVFGSIVASFAAGGGLTAIGAWLLNKRKVDGEERRKDAEERRKDAEQPVVQMSEIIKELRSRIAAVEKESSETEIRHAKEMAELNARHAKEIADCLERHAKVMFEVGKLSGELNEQRDRLRYLSQVGVRQATEGIKQAGAVVQKGLDIAAAKTGDSGILLSVDREHPLPVTVVGDRNDVRGE